MMGTETELQYRKLNIPGFESRNWMMVLKQYANSMR